MASQADSSLPNFSPDDLPELRRDPSPAEAFWFAPSSRRRRDQPPPAGGEGPRRAAQMVGFGARTQVRARHFQPPPRAAHDSCREEHPDGGSLIHEVPAQNGWTAGAGGRSCGSATCRRNAAWDW
eukprot:CAMPEP_0180341004 /NCGR_PEP_ID=MMETSP0989-20121125/965_1 /TAXON_ID=697907 /ORGANISM="non described non described, Strain CCMP2293" /LENGTH=124 /DNA_ID=CAMNT_0022329753 /DNA_START=787 /DNA_END=1159 /DNA_ORIENTATION=-